MNSRAETPQDTEPKRFSGGLKMAMIAGGGIAAVTVLGALLSVVGSITGGGSETQRKPVSSDLIAPITATAQKPAATEVVGNREELWRTVGVQHSNLLIEIEDVQEELRLSRAQRWVLHAQSECNKEPDCDSAYSWLVNAYEVRRDRLMPLITSNVATAEGGIELQYQLQTNADTANAFRAEMDTLQDIAKALSITQSGTIPRPMIGTQKLSDAMRNFASASKSFEALTTLQEQAPYAEPATPAQPLPQEETSDEAK